MSSQPQQTQTEVVQRLFDGIDDHDLDVMEELLAEGYTTDIYRSGTGESIDGREGMKELWSEYWEAFPDLTGVSTELISEDDRVAVFREEEGTHEGDFRGIAPTGEEITFEYAGYFVVEDGQIVKGHFLGNIMNLLQQLGVESPIAG